MQPVCDRLIAVCFILCGLALNAESAHAQLNSDKPIRLIVPFAAGGGTDLLARLVGQKFSEQIGQPVVIDNRAGANTVIGTEAVARAAPDGFTIGITATPIVANPSLYSKLPYDISKDFTWITQLTNSSLVVLASNEISATSIQELIALANKNPGGLTFGSGGAGGSPHLAAVLLERMAGIQMTHVPYKGNALAIGDLIAGRLAILFGDIPQVDPYIKAGKVKALAVTTLKRSRSLPETPTIAESGLSDYQVSVWYGIYGPANLSIETVSKLYMGLKTALESPEVTQQLTAWGVEPVASTPAEFGAFIKGEAQKWDRTIKEANIRLD